MPQELSFTSKVFDVETLDLPWGSFNIWGATAGMLLTLRETLGVTVADGD